MRIKSIFNIAVVLAASALALSSCDPIEDMDARNKYANAGTPVSKADLTAALSVKQLPNADGKVEGDQYVIVKNNKPEIGGVWKFYRGSVVTTYATDADTIVLGTNGDYKIVYEGISANQRVVSDTIRITVTNVFDIFDRYLTGATDKADKSAKKVWRFRKVQWGSYCNMGAYGGWKYTSAGYTPESNFAWWSNITDLSTLGNQSMVMSYNGTTMTIYEPDGTTVRRSGSFAYTHTVADELVKGELTMSVRTMGGEFDETSTAKTDIVYWILTLDDKYMTLFHPVKYTGGVDWDSYGWYVYYECE